MRVLLMITICTLVLVLLPEIAMAKGRYRGASLPRDLSHPIYSAFLLFVVCGGLVRFILWVRCRIASPAIAGVLSRLGYATLASVGVIGGLALMDHTKNYEPPSRGTSYQTSHYNTNSTTTSGGARFVSVRD